MHEVGDQGGQPVVVAEPDLAGGDGVVLVHDRQHAELEQLGEGLVGVAVVAAPGHVVGGEQHLSGDEAVGGELLGVAVHEQALADCRGCLLGGQRAGAALQAERRESGRDRTGRDQDDLGAAAACARASTSTSRRTRSGSMPPSAVVSEDEPTLTTTRRAAAICSARATARSSSRSRRRRRGRSGSSADPIS